MSLQSVLEGCHDALRESAKMHRQSDDPAHGAMCDLQADAALLLMDDPEGQHSPARKETNNGPA
jgi:hypothetical protein